jgi:Fe-Mn family superoxide dismutase
MGDSSIPAFAPVHQPKLPPFDPARLDGLSEKLIHSHWENNYGGSVKALNAVKQKLAQALADKDTPPFLYDDLKREHLMRTGSVVFHELYFENLGGRGEADAQMRKSIGAAFGGFEAWKGNFAGSAQVSEAVPAGWCSGTTCIQGRSRTTGWRTTCTHPRPRCHCW